ncbi:hypothetical protein [Sporohalobacter salinus]|uniref:hypothetical protein n=1 Tax=Sporohalobacter salinus TaxID=1494606 RepID=UPI00195F4A14|nr:hypothetical protein [Sporohalobacter salinus]MBM7624756.1 transcriptional regulator with XRE-family HTH domain [Sporohalobacter salinus]
MRKVEFLKQEMERLDISQKELAKLLYCSRSNICKKLQNPTEEFLKRAAKAIGSARLKMIMFGDTTAPVYFDQAYIAPHSSLDKMEEEALQLVDYIQELKRKRNYHNVRDYDECSRELKQAYEKVAEKTKDINHCSEHVDVALDEFGIDLEKRDRKCNLKYIDRNYVSKKTVITRKDTCSGKASVSI